MDTTAEYDIRLRRLTMAGIGLVAGLCFFALAELLPDVIDNPRVLLALAVAGLAGFGGTLVMTGPVAPPQAALGAVPVALAAAALAVWSSFRFDTVEGFLEAGYPFPALALPVGVFLPFWVAARRRPGGWRDYELLFDEAWRIIVRGALAAAFTGVVWGLIALSDALLSVVDIGWIGDLMDVEWVAFALSGLLFGLGLAVVHEFAGTVSPYLPLRLLRLVLPLLVPVTALFLVALPFRGLSGLFGDLSAAGVLMAVALTGIASVAIAIDRRDDLAVGPGVLRVAARVMTAFLPVLGLLAGWAVAIRVGQYGWSPDRLAAAAAAFGCTVYGLGYAGSVILGSDWMAGIRSINRWLAIAVALFACLWLTPLIDPGRLSAESQIARLERGATSLDQLDLWTLSQDWGRAGREALGRLARSDHPDADTVAERLRSLDEAPDRRAFEAALPPGARAALVAEILERLPVYPAGAALPAGLFSADHPDALRRMRAACDRRTQAGTAGCAAVVGDFLPATGGDEVLLLMLNAGYLQMEALVPGRPGMPAQRAGLGGDIAQLSQPGTLDALAAGTFGIAPVRLQGLAVDGNTVFIQP